MLERADAIAEDNRGGIDGLSFFNLGDERGADDGGVGEAAKNGNVAGQRDAKANGDGELRDAAGAAKVDSEFVTFSRRSTSVRRVLLTKAIPHVSIINVSDSGSGL